VFIPVSCYNNNFQSDDYKVKDGYKKHEIIFENKRISFVIPEYYSDTYKPNKEIWEDDFRWFDLKKVFYSTKNDYNSIEFIIFEDIYDESSIDEIIPVQTNVFIHLEPPMVPFYEKRKDNNGHTFYLCAAACIDRLKEENELPEEEKNSVYSEFDYMLCISKKSYVYRLISREPIKDFSYEEKKYIIESVRIEEIK
jgi:hypothetical protein